METKEISPQFIFIILFLLFGVVGFLYRTESKKSANSEVVSGIVVRTRAVPKKCLIEAKVESGRYGATVLRVSVPFWDGRKVGESIRLRVDRNDSSIVEVDELLYLHKATFGVLAGTAILGVVLVGGFLFKKR